MEESYFEVVFKAFYSKFQVMKTTFGTLRNTKFPKNNYYSLLNTEINKSLNFIIEIFSTLGSFSYTPNLLIIELISEMVKGESSILALIRLCDSENGVIKMNSFTSLFILMGYLPDLKDQLLKFASLTLMEHIKDSSKDYNITTFAINMSSAGLCLIPDIVGFKTFYKSIFSQKLNCKTTVSFSNSFSDKFPILEEYTKFDTYTLNLKGEVIEEGELVLRFITETRKVEGNLINLVQVGPEEYESVMHRVAGSFRPDYI